MLLGVVNGLRNDQLTAHIVEAAAIFEIASRCPTTFYFIPNHTFVRKSFHFYQEFQHYQKICRLFLVFMIEFGTHLAQCLKITEKVSFNIASEASYIYIWVDKSSLKMPKNGPFVRVFENLKLAIKQCYQTGHKLVKNAKIEMRYFWWISNTI